MRLFALFVVFARKFKSILSSRYTQEHKQTHAHTHILIDSRRCANEFLFELFIKNYNTRIFWLFFVIFFFSCSIPRVFNVPPAPWTQFAQFIILLYARDEFELKAWVLSLTNAFTEMNVISDDLACSNEKQTKRKRKTILNEINCFSFRVFRLFKVLSFLYRNEIHFNIWKNDNNK